MSDADGEAKMQQRIKVALFGFVRPGAFTLAEGFIIACFIMLA